MTRLLPLVVDRLALVKKVMTDEIRTKVKETYRRMMMTAMDGGCMCMPVTILLQE